MRTIGLTGAVGCGKSTVLNFFAEMGWKTVDADRVCIRLHEDPESGIHSVLESRWGKQVLLADGTTNRKSVAEIVFADPEERKWLESVLHPFIFREIEREIKSLREIGAYVMLDAPLLFESSLDHLTEKTIAVWSPFAIQLERLLARGWSREHAEKRIRSQFSAEKKLELADYGIINHSTLPDLKKQCIYLHRFLMS